VTLGTLALIVAVGLAGPLLAWSERLRIPVVVGELAAGVLVGRTGLQLVDSTGPTFSFLADVGFAMLMFIAGTHVPIRDRSLLTGLPRAVLRLVVVAAAAAGLGAVVGRAFGRTTACCTPSCSPRPRQRSSCPSSTRNSSPVRLCCSCYLKSPLLMRRASLRCRWSSTPPTLGGRRSAPWSCWSRPVRRSSSCGSPNGKAGAWSHTASLSVAGSR